MSEKCERCDGYGNYYIQIVVFGDEPILVKCDDCNGTGKIEHE